MQSQLYERGQNPWAGSLGPSRAQRTGAPATTDVPSLVFVVDHDAHVRESLRRLICAHSWGAETFTSGAEFLLRPRPAVPCCLVLDATCPGIGGLDLQRQVAERTEMPVIFIAPAGDVTTTVQAMKAGAFDVMTKPLQIEALQANLRMALERSCAALLAQSAMRTLQQCYASLTRREREVMTLVVSGLLNKQVGGELGISEITVKAHRGQVMRKMKAGSLPDLVTMAARLGLQPVATQ
jgi:FixJ family two-component response regulator